MTDSREDNAPLIILPGQLSAEALHALVEEYVTRDGTDYGESERSIVSKFDTVMALLKSRKAYIIFDEQTGSADIVDAEKLGSLVGTQLDELPE